MYVLFICVYIYTYIYIYAIHVLIDHPLWEPPALHGGSQLSHRRRWSRCYPSGRCPMPRAGLMPGLMLKSISVGNTCILLMYSYNCMYIHYIYICGIVYPCLYRYIHISFLYLLCIYIYKAVNDIGWWGSGSGLNFHPKICFALFARVPLDVWYLSDHLWG